MSGCYCAALAYPPCGWCDGPDRTPFDVPVPGLEAVRTMELPHPPVAELPRADPKDFTLTAEVIPPHQTNLFDKE